jgi:hypothetical protein
MRVFATAFVIALLAGPAYAQTGHVPTYGEPDKEKSLQQIQAEKDAQSAYHRSLGNFPDKGPTDPWATYAATARPRPPRSPHR